MIKFIVNNIIKRGITPVAMPQEGEKTWIIERHGGRYSDAWREVSVSHNSATAFRCYNSVDSSIKQGGVRITCDGRLISSRWVPMSRRHNWVSNS